MISYEGMEFRVLAYLGGIRRRYADMDACGERLSEARRKLEVGGISYDPMPRSPNAYGDAIPDGLSLLQERCEEMSACIAEHEAEVDMAWRLCRPLVSENRYTLWLHYVQGMEWAKVANALCVSEPTVYRMRMDGIAELYDAMPEEHRRDDAHKAES